MSAYIENEDLLINESDAKKLKSALNRVKKALDEIIDLGYEVYVSEHGRFNVMNVEGAGGYKYNKDYSHDMVVADIFVSGVDGGAW